MPFPDGSRLVCCESGGDNVSQSRCKPVCKSLPERECLDPRGEHAGVRRLGCVLGARLTVQETVQLFHF